MKILQLISPTGFFGAERWVMALAGALDSDSVQCDLAVTSECAGRPIEIADRYALLGNTVHRVEMSHKFDVLAVWRLVKLVRRERYDIVHSHGYKSDLLSLCVARLTGTRCVSTPHGFGQLNSFRMKLYVRLGCLALRYFDAVVPLSPKLVSDIVKTGVPYRKIYYIANGVDLDLVDKEKALAEKEIQQRGRSQKIGFVGRLVPGKEAQQVLQIFDRLWSADAELTLAVLGDGPLGSALKRYAKSLASSQAIHFLGFRDDALQLLSGMDLFVMTSASEGIPRSMMEAMALGVPVVAYDIPGVDQLVSDGKTGLLAPFGDQVRFAEACRRLLDDDALASRLSAQARTRIESEFSASAMATEYSRLYFRLTDTAWDQTELVSGD